MEPLGLAMQAFFDGDHSAQLIIHRDDGEERYIPIEYFFRDGDEFTFIDNKAIALCRGHVLDAGAGTGIHSLALRKKGLSVTSIDISSHAVEIMRRRGLEEVVCADIFDFHGGPFDSILMMGHGIGIVETIAGLDRFLFRADSILARRGQILLDSIDVRATTDESNLAYHEVNRRAGRYIGEVRIQLEFQGKKGPYCGWLHVTPDTLKERAAAAGWQCDVILRESTGDYLARLIKVQAA
jgi:SAM-dependent methyltransferase